MAKKPPSKKLPSSKAGKKGKGKRKSADPHYEREKKKYGKPIPSREHILEFMQRAGRPLKRIEIGDAIGIHSDNEVEQEAFRRRMKAMIRDGQVIKNRTGYYVLVNNTDLIRGVITGHPDGFGHLKPDDGSDKIFLPPREMRAVLHNDTVVVRITGLDRKGDREGAIVELVSRGNHTIVGRFHLESGIGFVVPENRRINQDILIPQENINKAQEGQIVVAEITQQPAPHHQPIGKIIEILGEHMAPGMEIDIASRVYGIPVVWPEGVEQETAKFKTTVPTTAKKDRVDLRDLSLVTIDGEDARDFDDAVYCEPVSNGWKLIVAIADVAHYVKPGMELDAEAQNRGTSVYFPDSVIPMLPEKLSNGLCSINPKVDRLCMVCEMVISKNGKVQRSKFYEAVMRSKARLTYTEVAAILVDGDKDAYKKWEYVVPHLRNLWDVYKALRKARRQRGAIDFDTVETQIIFNEERKIEKIVPTTRNEAHLLIEECMVAANVCAAKFVEKFKVPALFRDHDTPKETKLEMLYQFLGQLGFQLGTGDGPTSKDYAELVEKIKDRLDFNMIQTVLLRSLSQADYRPENIGHFGLALEHYAHFTSPIRRYPDLLLHRAIKHIIKGGDAKSYLYSFNEMEDLGKQCSMAERRADDATRDVMLSLKCQYMHDKIGEEYDGLITGVTSFGMFVEITDVYVEGLVHVTAMGNDYFHFDPVVHTMRGERTGKVYRLGDKVHIQVVRVDIEEKQIDFDLVSEK
ncbi:MAG: ribonuclease R [Gammaproteobacteria bacterium]|nr:MAG: ribonuclease R [Gammaproteobacteria bacterium]